MTQQPGQHSFLKAKDELGVAIDQKAIELFSLLKTFDASRLQIEQGLKDYFINHHLNTRLFFSIQNSAHIIYRSVQKKGRPIHEINIVDYGAGLGTLYLLAGMLNFKRVVYNDYLPDWKNAAQTVSEALNIPVNSYITGDIDAVLKYGDTEGFTFDIIASRNVVEHIYDLPLFYSFVFRHNPAAIIFSTTTANYHNPAMRLLHYFIHIKAEKKDYGPSRKEAIRKEWPAITSEQLDDLLKKTRGKAKNDFYDAIESYRQHQPVTIVPYLRSNTCIHSTGYWCEHLLTRKEHGDIITGAGYKIEYSPGYWDTHYKSVFMNIAAKIFNYFITLLGGKGYLVSPFVNIVAFN